MAKSKTATAKKANDNKKPTMGTSPNGFPTKTSTKGNTTYAWPVTITFGRLSTPDTKFDPDGSFYILCDVDKKVEDDVIEAGIQAKPMKEGDFKGQRKFKYNINEHFPEEGLAIFDEDGEPVEGYSVGSGTKAVAYVQTYETKMGTGNRLMALRVTELVESDYEPGNRASAYKW